MKPAAKLFYLSLFTLWGGTAQCQSSQGQDDEECAISPKAIVSDACASYSTLERLNSKTKPAVDDLVRNTDFFSHYRLNLFHTSCPFWNDENAVCGNSACAVTTIDNEEDIPEVWRASELSKLEGPKAKHPGKSKQREQPQKPLEGSLGENVGETCVVEYDDECDDRDYCVPEDYGASGKGEYVSLLQNPERFTGYGGDSARMVWDAVYRENCFQKSSFPKSASLGSMSPVAGPAAHDFRAVLQQAARNQALEQLSQGASSAPISANTGPEPEDECLEKRVFYRIVSGMHTSITSHLCWDFFNRTTGEWQHNKDCYIYRLHKFPDRVSNLYFNYALLTRAIAKIGPHLQDYTFCSGDPIQDAETKSKLLAVTERASSVPELFDENLMFKNGEGPSLKEDFRNRFRNVSRLMDCTGCDKCRLWGKLQTAGYGAALKILFEFDNEAPEIPELKRTELVALFNTYARASSSMDAIRQFRLMVEADEAAAATEATKDAEETTPNPPPDAATEPDAVSSGQSADSPPEQPESDTASSAVDEGTASAADASEEATSETQVVEETEYSTVSSAAEEETSTVEPEEETATADAEKETLVVEAEKETPTIEPESETTITEAEEETPTIELESETSVAKVEEETSTVQEEPQGAATVEVKESATPVPVADEKAPEAESESDEWEGDELPPPRQQTVKEAFDSEFERVQKAFIFVIKGWVNFPKNLYYAFLNEAERLWQAYVGLPISPRTWRIERPNLDEL